MNQRKEQKEKRRQEILIAGLELFIKKGYSSTKISDIAQAAAMSDGLLFHYFETKEALYEELIRIGMDTSREWISTNRKNPLDFFEKAAELIFSMIRENPISAQFFVLLAQAQRSGAEVHQIAQMLTEQKERFQQSVELIRAGQAAGDIREGDPEALTWTFWCSIQGIAEQLAVHPETPLPQAGWFVALLKREVSSKGA